MTGTRKDIVAYIKEHIEEVMDRNLANMENNNDALRKIIEDVQKIERHDIPPRDMNYSFICPYCRNEAHVELLIYNVTEIYGISGFNDIRSEKVPGVIDVNVSQSEPYREDGNTESPGFRCGKCEHLLTWHDIQSGTIQK